MKEPVWAEEFEIPGLDQKHIAVEQAKKKLESAQSNLANAERARDDLTQLRSIMWTQGKHVLETAVRMAFKSLGFSNATPEAEVDAVLYEANEAVAFVEIEGTKGQMGVRKYRQLRDYVDNHYLKTASRIKGILVANAFLEKHPDERGDQFSPEAIRGALGQGFCLISTTELFKLVHSALDNPSDANKKDLRKRLLGHNGVFVSVQS